MSDDLRRAVRDLQASMHDVNGKLQDLQSSQRLVLDRTDSFARTFDGFQARFNEVTETLIQSDTDALHWRAEVDRDLANVKERLERLEKPPAA